MAAEVGASAGAQQQIALPPEGADLSSIQDEDLLRRMVLKDLMQTTLDGGSGAADGSATTGGVSSTVVTTTTKTYAASESGDSVGGGGLVVTKTTETIRGGGGSQESLVITYRSGGNEDENLKNIEMDRRQLQGSTEYIYESGGKTTRSSRTQMSSSASTQSSMITKNANYGIHSQSLADQGFLTLKSKEIRDSESPTRDFIPARQIQQTSTVSRGTPGGAYWYEESRSYHTGDDGTEGVQYGAKAGQQGYSSSTEYGKDGSTLVTRHGGEALISSDHKEEVSKTSRKEESSSAQQFSSSSSYSYSSGNKSTQDWVEKHIADDSFERQQPMAIESSRRATSEDRHESQEKIVRDSRESVERTSKVQEQHVSRMEKEVDSKVEERRTTVDETECRQSERVEDREDATRGPKHKVTQRSKTGELPLDVNLAKQQIITTTSTTTEVFDASVPSTATSTPAPESGPAPDGASWTIVSGKQNGVCSSTDEFVFRSGTTTTEKSSSNDVTEKVITSETTTRKDEKTATDKKPTAPSQPVQPTEAGNIPTAGKQTPTDSMTSSPVVEVKSIMKQTTTTTTSTGGSQQPIDSNNITYYTQAKRISTDLSPSHEAFARSLRSSPEKTTNYTRASSKTSIDTNTTILSSPTRSQRVSVTSPTGPGGLITDRPRDRTSPLKQSSPSPSASKEKRKLSSSLSRGMAPKRTATPGASPSTSPVRGRTPCSDDESEPRKPFESTSEKRRSVIRREGSPLSDQPSRKSPAKETKPSSRKTPEKSPARDLPREDTTDTTKVQRKTSETIIKEAKTTSLGRKSSKGQKDDKPVTRKPSSDKLGSPVESLPKDKSPSTPNRERKSSEDKKSPTSPQRPKDLDLKSRTTPGAKDTTPNSTLTDITPKEPKEIVKPKHEDVHHPESQLPADKAKEKPLPVAQPQELDDNFDVVCEVYPDDSLVNVVTPSSLPQRKPGDGTLEQEKVITEDLFDLQVKEKGSLIHEPEEKPSVDGEKISPHKKSPEDRQEPNGPREDDNKPSAPLYDDVCIDRPTRRDSLPGRRSPTTEEREPISPSRRTPIRDSPDDDTQKKESPISLRESDSSPSTTRKSPARESPREESVQRESPSPVRKVPSSSSPSRKSPARDLPKQVSPSPEKAKPSSMSPSRKTPEKDTPSALTTRLPSTGNDSPSFPSSRSSPARSSPARDSPNYSPSRPSPTRDSPSRDSPTGRATEDKPKTRKSPARDSPVRDVQRKESQSPLRDTERDTSSPARKSPAKDDLKKDSPKYHSPSPSRESPKAVKERKPSTEITIQSPIRKSPAREVPAAGVTSHPSPERESPCRRHHGDRSTPESSPVRKPSLKDSIRKDSPARKTPERDISRGSPTRRSPSKDTAKKTPERELPLKSTVRQSPAKDIPEKKPVSRKSSEREIVPKKEPSARRSQSSDIPATKKFSPPKTDDTPTSTRKSPPKETVVRKIPQYTSPSRKPVTSHESPASERPTVESPSGDKPWRQSPYKSPGRDSPQTESQQKTPVKEYPSSGIPRTMSPARKPGDSYIPYPDSPKQKEPKAPCTAVLYDKQPVNQRRSRSPEKIVPRKISNEKGNKPSDKPISRIPGRAPANGTPSSPRRQTPTSSIPSYQSPLRRTPKDDSSPASVRDSTTPQSRQPFGRPQSGGRLPDCVEHPRTLTTSGGRITATTTTKTEFSGKPKKPKKKTPKTGRDSSEEDEEGSTTESDTEREIVEEKTIVTEKEVRRVNEMLMQDMGSELCSIPNGAVSDRPISLSLITTTTKTTTSGGEMLQTIDADGKITTTTIHQPTTTTMSMSTTTRDIEGHEETVARTTKNTTYPGGHDEDEDVEIMEIDDDIKPAIEYTRDTSKGPGIKPFTDGTKRLPSQLKAPKKEPKQQIPTSIGRRPMMNDYSKSSAPVEPTKKKTPMSTSPPKVSGVRKAPSAKPGIPSPIPIVSHAPGKPASKSPGKPEQISRLPAKNVPKTDIRSVTSTTGRTTTQQQKTTVSSVMTSTTNRQQTNRISSPQKTGKQPVRGEPLIGCIAKKPTQKGRIPQKTGKLAPAKDAKKSAIPSKKAPYTEQPKDELETDEEEEEVDVETPIPSDVEIIDKYDYVDDVETTMREKLTADTKQQVKVTDYTDEKPSSLHPSSAGITPSGMPSAPEIRPISRESTPDTQGKRQPRYADRVSEPDDDELYYEERTTQKREQIERTVNITMPRLETVEQKFADEEEFDRIPRRPEQVTDLDEDEPKPVDEDDDIEPANLSVSSKVSRFLAASVNAAAPPQPSQTPKFSEPKRAPRTSWEPENDSPKQPNRDEVDQRTITTDDTSSLAVKRARNIFETIARAPEASPSPMSPKLKTDVLGKASFFETKQTEELRSAQRVLRKSFTGSDESLGDDGLPKEKPRTVYTDSEEDYEDDIQEKVSPMKKPFSKEPSPGRLSKPMNDYESPKESFLSQTIKPQAEKPFTKESSPVRKYSDKPERYPTEKPDEYDEKPSYEIPDAEESPEKTSPIDVTPKSSVTKRTETETDVTRRRNLFRDAGPTPSDEDMSPKVKKTSVGSTMGREAFLKRMSKFASTTTETSKPLKPATEPAKAKPASKFPVGGTPSSKTPRGDEPTKDSVRERESPSRKAPTDTGMRRVSTDEGTRRSPARDTPTKPSDTFTRRPSKGGDDSPKRTPTRETTAQKLETTRKTVEETRFSTDTFTRRSSKEIRKEETTTRDVQGRPTDSPTKPKTERTPVTEKFSRRPSKERFQDESPRRPREEYPRGTDTFTKKPKSESRESPQRESPSRASPGRDLDDQPKNTGTYTRKKSTDRLKESSPSPRSSPSRDTYTRRPVSEDIPRTSVTQEPEEKKPVASETFPRRRSQPKEEEPEKTPSAMDALKPYLRTRNQEFPGDDESQPKINDKTPKKLSSSRFDTFTKRDSSTAIKDDVRRTLSPGVERTPKKLSGTRFETFTKRDSSTAVKGTEGVEYRTKSVVSSVTSTTERKSVERETEMTTKTDRVTTRKEQTESPSRTDRRTPDRKTPERTDRRTPDRTDRRTPDRSDRRAPDRRTPDRKDDTPAGYGEPLRKKPTKDVQDEPVRKAPRPEEDEMEARTSTRRRPSKEGSPRPATTSSPQRKPEEEIPEQTRRRSSGGKFGVVLRQTSSVGSRVEALMSKVEKKTTGSIASTVVLTPTRRRSSKGPESGLDIEEIYDLELLEQMLEKATDYDQRRRIRAQIRLVRRGETSGAAPSTPRDSTPSRPATLTKTTSKPSQAPTTPQQPASKEPSPAREDVEDGRRPSSSSVVKTRRGSSQPRDSPDREKPSESPRKPSRAEEIGGELTSPSVVAKLLPSTGTPSSPAPTRSPAPKKTSLTSSGLPREACPTDSITSSYGVGPTDDSGRPLFGLRALRRPKEQAPPPDTTPSAPAPSPNIQSREASLEPRPQSPETSDVRDSSGRPLFGLRAITIGSSSTTSSRTTKDTRSQPTEQQRSPQRRPQEDDEETESEDEGTEMPSTSTTTTETSVQLRDLVRRHEQNARGNTPSQPVQLQKPRAKLRDSFILSHDEDEETQDSPSRPSGPEPTKGVSSPASKTFPSALAVAESGKITERSTSLKSIIQRHEKIADTETTNNKLNRRDSGLGAYTEEEDLVPARNNYLSRAQDYSTDEEDEEYDDEEFQDYNNGDHSETTTVKVTSDVVKRPGILKKPKDNEAPESSSTTSTASTIRSQQTVTERSSGYVSSKKDVLRGVVDDSEDGAERPTKGSSPTSRRPADDEESPATPSSRATYSSYTTSSSSSSVSKSAQDASLERRRSSNTVPYTVEEVDGDSNDGNEVSRSPSENRYEATTTTVTRRYASSSDSPKVVTSTTTVTRTSGGGSRPDEEAEETRVVKKKFPAATTASPRTTTTNTTGFSRVARGGSVRALSQKFQQAAEAASSGSPESPSRAYPKAGLIFRTNSFRQQAGSPLSPSSPLPPCHSASSPAIHPLSQHLTNGHSGTKTVSGEVVERRTVASSVTRAAVSSSQKDDELLEQQARRRSVENDRVSSPTTRKGSDSTTTSSSRVRRVSDDEQEEEDFRAIEQRTVVTNGSTSGRSFLGNQNKVTGVQDVLSRMREADNEGPAEGDTAEDSEARALLNKFLGAQVILQGMEPLINAQSPSLVRQVEKQRVQKKQETVTTVYTSDTDLDGIWDERRLQQLLESCNDYDGRRKIRARIRTVMAEQKVTAAIVAEGRLEAEREGDSSSKALVPKQPSGEAEQTASTTMTTVTRTVQGHSEATTMSSSLDSSVTKTEVHTKSSNYSATVTGKSRVSKAPPSKTMSPFAKFKQLDEQNSSSAPNSPKSPGGTGPLFKFTDPQLSRSASGVKDKLLYWCQMKTKEYKNIQIENFSTSWSNGLAFCALIHHFCPEAFDYDTLRPEERRKNFELAFQVADDKAGIAPLLDVEDMVMMRKPDWKCVFTYVQSIYRRFKDED
ncbi:serine/arginine repetitive matrix protein 2-like isoform X3 [Ischnura elegans]|uniref:serine/arginine repetitive matrix protein 2-like isoform X3 n=1 Tax=Ischnura elegans TaxID=197161 RepID=UPI001ED89485|nr:serine/arginine repetitive matrix protein 2-like isoform X3 [Ischnura elegans]